MRASTFRMSQPMMGTSTSGGLHIGGLNIPDASDNSEGPDWGQQYLWRPTFSGLTIGGPEHRKPYHVWHI